MKRCIAAWHDGSRCEGIAHGGQFCPAHIREMENERFRSRARAIREVLIPNLIEQAEQELAALDALVR